MLAIFGQAVIDREKTGFRISRGAGAQVFDEKQRVTLRPVGVVGALFFGTGFVALGGEVLWTRFLALVVPNTVHTYTLTIGATLVGLVLGSALAGLLADRLRSRALAFGAVRLDSPQGDVSASAPDEEVFDLNTFGAVLLN